VRTASGNHLGVLGHSSDWKAGCRAPVPEIALNPSRGVEMSPRETAIKILRSAVGGCDDNLYRAKLSFQNHSPEEMQEQHGQSGQTRQQVLDGYIADKDQKQAALDWAISA